MALTPPQSVWFQRISIAISCFICYGILIYNLLKLAYVPKTDRANKNQLWLNRFSIATIIFATLHLTLLLIYSVPILCVTLQHFIIPSHHMYKVTLVFYQISRLQYCFNMDYSKWTFIFLYSYGIIILIYDQTYLFFYAIAMIDKSIGFCYITVDPKIRSFIPLIGSFFRYIWDVSVFMMYVRRVHHLKDSVKINSWNTKIAIKNITKWMHKILLLNLIWGMITLSAVPIPFAFLPSEQQLALALGMSFDAVVSCIIILLMVEHNHNIYTKLIKVFTKWKLCCCCQTFVYKSIGMFDDDEPSVLNANRTKNISSITTITVGETKCMDRTNTLGVNMESTIKASITPMQSQTETQSQNSERLSN